MTRGGVNRRAPFAVWAVVGLLALLLAPSDAAAQLGEAQIRKVRFEGNNTFSGDSLSRAIVTRQTECKSLVFEPFCLLGADWAEQKYYLRQAIVPVDMLRLQVWYRRRGFRDTQVDTATIANADGTADVLFRISEGRPVLVDSHLVQEL